MAYANRQVPEATPSARFTDGTEIDVELRLYTIPQIIDACDGISLLSKSDKRTRASLFEKIRSMTKEQQEAFRKKLSGAIGTKKRKLGKPRTYPHKKAKVTPETPPSITASTSNSGSPVNLSTLSDPSSIAVTGSFLGIPVDPSTSFTRYDWREHHNEFFQTPSEETVHKCISNFIDKTGNEATSTAICAVCARELPISETRRTRLEDIPNSYRLHPSESHSAHILLNNMLLYNAAVDIHCHTQICHDCGQALASDRLPKLALANGMWIGDVPLELSILTLPERLLIAKYFPAAYIVKLFPKARGSHYWDQRTMNSALKGNVSTYRLDNTEISAMVDDNIMPPPAKILSATIGVTFVGPKNLPERTLPDFLRVRRRRVYQALVWLKNNNPIYRDITISELRLAQLPENAVPEEILAGTKYSSDTEALNMEQAGYVPQYDEEGECMCTIIISELA